MKKQNFKESEISKIVVALGPKFSVRLNKAGNITVCNPSLTDDFWTLYLTRFGKYLWRKHDGYYCFPLNMKNRKNITKIIYSYTDANGVVNTYENFAYDINKNCVFDTVDEALAYFVKYLAKYWKCKV